MKHSRICPVCYEKVSFVDFRHHVSGHAAPWCSVCGVVVHRHPWRTDTSPANAIPCKGGKFIRHISEGA